MFSGPKPLVLSTSSSPPCLPLGVLPVDLLAARLDDVEVEVGVGVPDQGELGVADLDRDAADRSRRPRRTGRGRSRRRRRPGVVVGHAAAGARLRAAREPDDRLGLELAASSIRVERGLGGRAGARASPGIVSGVFRPPVERHALGTPLAEPASRVSNAIGGPIGGAKYQSARHEQQDGVQRQRAGPALERLGGPEAGGREPPARRGAARSPRRARPSRRRPRAVGAADSAPATCWAASRGSCGGRRPTWPSDGSHRSRSSGGQRSWDDEARSASSNRAVARAIGRPKAQIGCGLPVAAVTSGIGRDALDRIARSSPGGRG